MSRLLVPARFLAVLLAVCLAAVPSLAQSGPATPSQPSAPKAQPDTAPNPDDAWLAKTGRLYYSTTKAGLDGFDCAVHPDWHALFVSANEGAAIAGDDAHIALLNTVRINLHAHMQGGSTLDWNPDANPAKPLDDESTALLNKMHQATEQTLEGFLQFWTPFIDGSIVPPSAEGLAITHTGTLHTIHAEQDGTALTETFSNDLLLQHFDVKMNGISLKFQPDYKPTDQGLLVKSFQADVQAAGVPAEQAQQMRVDIEYQTLDGFPIPARLNMEVANRGKFNFVFDGCTVSRLQKPEPGTEVKPALQ